VAPISPEVYGGFLRRRGWRYVSIDRWRTGNPHDPRRAEFVDFELDVRDLRPFGDRAFQLIVVQHVIEEIDVYQQALRELARVLDRTGTALLEIPYRRNLPKSKSHPPDRYGNVWEFGADLLDAVRAVFASAEPRPLREGGYRGEVFVCRHQRREDTGRCCG
jgi:SAM-dependent methyltransferase